MIFFLLIKKRKKKIVSDCKIYKKSFFFRGTERERDRELKKHKKKKKTPETEKLNSTDHEIMDPIAVYRSLMCAMNTMNTMNTTNMTDTMHSVNSVNSMNMMNVTNMMNEENDFMTLAQYWTRFILQIVSVLSLLLATLFLWILRYFLIVVPIG